MSSLLIALVAVLLLPLFLASWRVSLAGLACQGFLMAWIAYRMHPALAAPATWIALVDLAVVRGVVAPLALRRVPGQRRDPRNDVIPPNLLSWTLAVGMVLVGFRFAAVMVPAGGDPQTLVAVASTGVLLALLVLSTQNGPFGQMIGVLRLENAIALFELGSGLEAESGVRLAQLALFVLTLALFRGYLRGLPAAGVEPVVPPVIEEPAP